MSDYDPLAVDSYATHLGQVNEVKAVSATQDIHNESGAVVVKKGMPVSSNVAAKILRFRLKQSLHDSVSIENEINAKALNLGFSKLMGGDLYFESLNLRYDIDTLIRSACQDYEKFDLLKQKVTVLSVQAPERYSHAMMTAWLSCLIGRVAKLSDEMARALFLSALCRDLGMLHIDPSIVNKQEERTPSEWRQIQAHTIIGQQILASIDAIPKHAADAVLEHHEFFDGTGYPRGKKGNELGQLGQIIALADSVAGIYLKQLIPSERSFGDVIPIIQMNKHAFSNVYYETLINAIRNSGLTSPGTVATANMPAFIEALELKDQHIRALLDAHRDLMKDVVVVDHENSPLAKSRRVHGHIIEAVRGSGVVDDGYLRWLKEVKDSKIEAAYREMEDVSLMMTEVLFQFTRVYHFLDTCISDENLQDKTHNEAISKILKEVDSIEQKFSTDPSARG